MPIFLSFEDSRALTQTCDWPIPWWLTCPTVPVLSVWPLNKKHFCEHVEGTFPSSQTCKNTEKPISSVLVFCSEKHSNKCVLGRHFALFLDNEFFLQRMEKSEKITNWKMSPRHLSHHQTEMMQMSQVSGFVFSSVLKIWMKSRRMCHTVRYQQSSFLPPVPAFPSLRLPSIKVIFPTEKLLCYFKWPCNKAPLQLSPQLLWPSPHLKGQALTLMTNTPLPWTILHLPLWPSHWSWAPLPQPSPPCLRKQ